MPLPIVPSARLVLRDALLAQSVLTATTVGTDIRLSKPSTWPGKAIIVLSNVDEIELRPECNECRVQVDLYGAGSSVADYEAIEGIAPILQSVSRDCDGNWAKGNIRKCRAPSRLPSPDSSGRARIIVDFELEVTPT